MRSGWRARFVLAIREMTRKLPNSPAGSGGTERVGVAPTRFDPLSPSPTGPCLLPVQKKPPETQDSDAIVAERKLASARKRDRGTGTTKPGLGQKWDKNSRHRRDSSVVCLPSCRGRLGPRRRFRWTGSTGGQTRLAGAQCGAIGLLTRPQGNRNHGNCHGRGLF